MRRVLRVPRVDNGIASAPSSGKDTLKGRVRTPTTFKAYCQCGKRLMDTTPDDVWNGIQPRCKDC